MTSIARRDTRSCSCPVGSRWLTSVMAGTWRSRPQRVEPPLIERNPACPPRRLRNPGDLVLQVAHELFDPDRRGDRLFALDAGKRRLAFLIEKVNVDQPAGDDRAAHEDDHGIAYLRKRLPRRIIGSPHPPAEGSTVGMVMPRALAVFRLTTRSIFVGRSTGRSRFGAAEDLGHKGSTSLDAGPLFGAVGDRVPRIGEQAPHRCRRQPVLQRQLGESFAL